jgi:cell division septum initiation protein DivIVA
MTLAHSEMPTPERVRSAAFTPTRLGRRGIDESEVRAFCEWIADGLGMLLNDNNMLQAEIMRLRDRLLEGKGRTGIQPEDAHVQAVQVLSQAQQTADRYVADAQEYSRELAEEARLRRDEILREAKVRASMILEDAHTTATRAADAARDTPEPIPAAERQDLQAEIAYLESSPAPSTNGNTPSTTAPSPHGTRTRPADRPSTSNPGRYQAPPAPTPPSHLPAPRSAGRLD